MYPWKTLGSLCLPKRDASWRFVCFLVCSSLHAIFLGPVARAVDPPATDAPPASGGVISVEGIPEETPQPVLQRGSTSDIEFFEEKIRPVLVEHCYSCHAANAKIVRGGLLLDSRDGLLSGGDTGAALIPGDAENSLLLSALKHESFEMPPDRKLPER